MYGRIFAKLTGWRAKIPEHLSQRLIFVQKKANFCAERLLAGENPEMGPGGVFSPANVPALAFRPTKSNLGVADLQTATNGVSSHRSPGRL